MIDHEPAESGPLLLLCLDCSTSKNEDGRWGFSPCVAHAGVPNENVGRPSELLLGNIGSGGVMDLVWGPTVQLPEAPTFTRRE